LIAERVMCLKSCLLKQAIRTEPESYAEILYPVMAPSIRRAISQAISSMLVTINQTIQSATSAQGIALRVESLRTGVPYAQLVLKKSLIYRVEHVYLIDRDTGLLIEHVKADDVEESGNDDAVSAMFSAIESFVQDSFSQDKSGRLTDMKVDERNVWLTHGPNLILACVVFGNPPESLKGSLYDTLDGIRTNYATQIEEFDGNSDAFGEINDEYLSPLLQFQIKSDTDKQNKKTKKMPLATIFFVFALVVLVSAFLLNRYSKLSLVEHFLEQTPGVEITDLYWDNGDIIAKGFQDPDADIPYHLFAEHGLEKEDLVFDTISFRSLEPQMELQRFNKEFDLPTGVALGIDEERVFLYGEAPIEWLLKSAAKLELLASDNRLDISTLSASESSIIEFLKMNFSQNEILSINTKPLFTETGNVVQINGRLDKSQVLLLKTLFLTNRWVDVLVSEVEATQ